MIKTGIIGLGKMGFPTLQLLMLILISIWLLYVILRP